MLQLTLHLELMPDFHHIVERLAAEGSSASQQELQRFLAWAANDPARQISVAAAQRGLAARGEGDAIDVADSALGDIYNRVQKICEKLPARPQTATSDRITPLRRALKELATSPPADPYPSAADGYAGDGAGAPRPTPGLRSAARGNTLDG